MKSFFTSLTVFFYGKVHICLMTLLFFIPLGLLSQVAEPPEPCDDGTQETCQCETAPVLCSIEELDGFEYSMSTFQHPQSGPTPLCNGVGVPNNPTYFAFIAWCEELTLNVEVSNCTNVCSGTNGAPCQFPCNLLGCTRGIQIAIYGDCNFNEVVGCNVNDCGNENDKLLALDGLVIGEVYYFLVDGCAGSSCDLRINVIGDCGVAEIEPWPSPIMGPDSICVGTSGTFSTDFLEAATLYHWYLDGAEIGVSPNPEIEIDFPFEGTYEICIDASNEPCIPVTDPPEQNCITVEVYFPIEYLGEFIVCQEDLPFQIGGNSFTQPGPNEFTVIEPDGCEILNQFDLEIIINEPLDVDTVLCKEDFPFFFGPTSETITGPGTVFVPATDQFGCDSSYFVNFYQIDFFVQFEVPEDTLRCPNQTIIIGATSTAVFIDDGFNSPVDDINYQWLFDDDELPGQTGPTIEAGAAGVYTLVINGVLGDLICSDTITIEIFEDFSQPPQPVLSLPDEVCIGTEFEVFVENSGGGFDTDWSVSDNGISVTETNQSIIISAVDTGIMEICAAFSLPNCPDLQSDSCFTIVIIDNFELDFEGETGFCSSESTVISVDSNFTSIFWNGEEGTFQFEVTESDSLEIVAFDSLGCRGEVTIFIEEFASPEPEIQGSTVFCEAGNTILSVSEEFDLAIWNGTDTAFTFTTNEPGLVNVFVVDSNNCVGESSVNITIAEELDVSIAGITEICSGESTTLTTDPIFPSYLWNTGETTAEINIEEAGIYFVTVDDGQGCFGFDTVEVVVNPLPTGEFDQSDDGICPGENIELVFNTQDEIDSFIWNTGDSTNQISISESGTYTINLTDENGCRDSFSIDIISFPEPEVEIMGEPEFCTGENTMLFIEGDFADISWSNNESSSEVVISTPGLYSVTITDNNGCIASDSLIIEELELPQPEIIGDTNICVGEQSTLSLNEVFESYNWSTGENTDQIVVNETGTYSVTVTASNGCINSADLNLTVNELPVIEFTGSTTFCTGFSTTISIGDFAEINWSTGETTPSINIDEEGTYTVSVVDENGCQAQGSITITEDEELQPTITGATGFCPGENTVLDVGEGFNTYLWNDGQTSSSITVEIPGVYSVTVTDADGCSGNTSVEVEEFPGPEPEITGDELVCFGESTELSLNQAFENYSWSTGENQASITINESGNYSVTVTDENNCEGTASFEFEVKDEIEITISGDFEICDGESAEWSVGDDFESYNWSDGTESPSVMLTNQGSYSITVTDIDGCTGEATAELIVNELPMVDAGVDQEINCLVSSVFIGEGVAPEADLEYVWINTETGEPLGDGIIQEITDAGIFELRVTNTITSCTTSDFVEVTLDPTDINSIAVDGIDPLCFNENSGTIIIENVVGGTSPYTYTINQVESESPEFTNLGEGEFMITVTDDNGCFKDTVITLSYPPELIVDLGSDVEISFGESALIIGEVSIGFDRIENIVWTINGEELCNPCNDLEILYDLPNSGIIELSVEDFNGCSDMDRINIFVSIDRNVYIPNAFSPNADGINDVFTIYGTEVIDEIEEMIVFDRWGAKVFERRNFPANEEVFGWDGTFNGERLNPAVFSYFIRVNFIDGSSEEFTGDILLTR